VPTSAKLQHAEGMKFNVELTDGRKIQLNSAQIMTDAFTPMELFLVSLAGCTAMDVQWIMDRQRQKLDRFEVSVNGTRREDDPRYYNKIDLEYVLTGEKIRKDAVERAIRLSQEKYCSVKAMMKEDVKINITYKIVSPGQPGQTYAYSDAPIA
jgi:putative redox protein